MIKILRKNEIFDIEEMNAGILLLMNKPAGWTSFDVVNKIRRIIKIKKVGHAGTLDPFAEGLLLIGIGPATKSLGRLTGLSKTYLAEVFMGASTDTYDVTGEITAFGDSSKFLQADINESLQKLTGDIAQIPPMFSAKKINGKRLYRLARQGKDIERQPVQVTVHSIDMLSWKNPILKIRLVVSKGTYIRSIAHDLGQMLGCGAHLSSLEREAIGDYRLEEAWTMDEFINRIESVN